MNTKVNYQYYQDRRRFIRSKVGQWHPGKGVTLRGYSLLDELYHNMSEAQLVVFSATGKMVDGALETWMDKTRFLLAYPDARIWCNQIASLAACQKASPVAAAVTSFLAADSRAYGSQIQYSICNILPQIYAQYQQGLDFSQLVSLFPKTRSGYAIPGFLRPVGVVDERLQPLRKLTSDLGFKAGPYLQFAEEFSAYLEQHMQLGINAAGYCCAFMLDQGFSADEIYLISVSNVEVGALACIGEYRDGVENGFLPLQCDDIEYQGPPPRRLPSASQQRKMFAEV